MCAIDDCEPWTVYREERPVARQDHCCDECRRTVGPGEKYLKITGLCDSVWQTYRLCNHCVGMSAWMNEMCGGWPLGQLLEELVEHWREGYTSIAFGRLIACMKHRWHDGADIVPAGMSEVAKQMLNAEVIA